MKKLLSILVLGLLLSGNAFGLTTWNYQKGYVYIAVKNNQNLDALMSKKSKILSGLNCNNGFQKNKLDRLPTGYAEDAPELLGKKYQPLNMYKITCATAVAEKPKKQEPKIIDYRATVLDSDLVLKNTKDSSLNTLTFYPDETAFWKGPDFSYKFFWKEKNNRGHFSVLNEEYKKKKAPPVIMKLDFQKLLATFDYPEGDSIKFKINKPNKPIYVAEKPKKQKPKKQTQNLMIIRLLLLHLEQGFYVSNTGHIISNHHVVEGCNTVKLTFKGKEVVSRCFSS